GEADDGLVRAGELRHLADEIARLLDAALLEGVFELVGELLEVGRGLGRSGVHALRIATRTATGHLGRAFPMKSRAWLRSRRGCATFGVGLGIRRWGPRIVRFGEAPCAPSSDGGRDLVRCSSPVRLALLFLALASLVACDDGPADPISRD